MSPQKRRLDRILEPEYLEGLQERSTDEVRVMKSDSAVEEALLSYERRMLHGRVAILRAELFRRKGGTEGSLVEQLPAILADEGSTNRGSFMGDDPQFLFKNASRRITKLVSDDTLANLPNLDDEEIATYIAELEEVEREVSATRRGVLDLVDTLNREIARRYRTGEADPSDVLMGR